MEVVERIDKGKGKEIMKEECNNKQSEMDIKVGGNEIEEVEDAMETLVLSVQSNRVE